jgi:hypothetical protein
MQKKIDIMKTYLLELQEHILKFKKGKDVRARREEVVLEEAPADDDNANAAAKKPAENLKLYIKNFPDAKDKTEK